MKLFIILGNQLFSPSYLKDFKDHIFYMSEDYDLCTYEKHHKLKILLFLSSMRSFRDELKSKNLKIIYEDINSKFKTSYVKKLEKVIKDKKIKEVSFFEIEDKPFEKKIISLLKKINIKVNQIKTPMFLTTREEFKEYLSKYKKPFMANFYKSIRTKLNILMNSYGKPKGNKWSFDEDNRKKLPKDIKIPEIPKLKSTSHTNQLKKFIELNFKDHPGNTENFWFPTTRLEAQKQLDRFLKERIKLFGDYEDAVSYKSNTMFHSALSPLINLGLITPEEILIRLKKIESKVPINSFEGYVRQIIGWREFMRGIYQNFDSIMDKSNFFNHKRSMKKSWYIGNTGLDPLDFSIKNAERFGWSHHIERLMILSNIMNLCEIHPKQVYKWFMEMFVDSSDWVMSPNVYGMGLFSDGGIFATKPYICGSSYFLKMMHFKKGPWCDVMDGLYWKFIDKNKRFFLKNPRLAMMVRISEKMSKERKIRIFKAANNFIKENTNG
ncbi:MAG: cryptochrome/photolyase family protein [Candidatus Pelagibacter sp. TMED239]|nr:MAG: cryptochrome/photolyase family protein [Candidatus Pelagibacter sp. TMED239]|tara:strand:+ start:629 stop:2110 length:1482 start_codon:yes stop_codon:yes gene_type:complete